MSEPDNTDSANVEELYEKVLRLSKRRHSIWLYKFGRIAIRLLGGWYFRVKVSNAHNLNRPERIIIAPVHRSNLDGPLINSFCRRRVRSLAKIAMFRSKISIFISTAIGAIPVDREKNHRHGLELAEKLLDADEALLLFPEGLRSSGAKVKKIFGGCAYLSIKTGAPILPVAIAGTESAMPPGKKIPRRSYVNIEVGDIISAPKSKSKSERDKLTEQIQAELQNLLDTAISKSELRR